MESSTNPKAILTKHSIERGNERLSLKQRSLDKLAQKALEKGLKHKDFSGQLRKYIDGLYLKNKNANNIRVYGENIFIFHQITLITVYQLPYQFKRILKHYRTSHETKNCRTNL